MKKIKWNKKKGWLLSGALLAAILAVRPLYTAAVSRQDCFAAFHPAAKGGRADVTLRIQPEDDLEDVTGFCLKFRIDGEEILDASLDFYGEEKTGEVRESFFEDGILTVYVSGRSTVLSREESSLGTIQVEGEGTAELSLISAETVNSFHQMNQITDYGNSESCVLVLSEEEDSRPEETPEAPEETPDRPEQPSRPQEPEEETVRKENSSSADISRGQNTISGNWSREGDSWKFKKSDGTYAVNQWGMVGGKWYYFGEDGDMKTGWLEQNGRWYFFGPGGDMKTGWTWSEGNWYYLRSSGAMKTGWVQDGSRWYYMKSSGAMKTGWLESDGKWYYMDENGRMLADCMTPDGYRLDRNGVWTENH